jgi:Family of unknown function (DUF5335)
MLRTTEVPHEEWSRALDEFSTIHQGWFFSLDVLSDTISSQPEPICLPLVGITFEPGGGGGVVTVTAAGWVDYDLTQTIETPRRLWLERTDGGAAVAVEIETVDGTKVIVRPTTPAPAETIDGISLLP